MELQIDSASAALPFAAVLLAFNVLALALWAIGGLASAARRFRWEPLASG
jgi:hypothetical protein